MSESKHKHLDYIQAVITRMAQNSFAIKGWTVTLTIAVLAIDKAQPGKQFALLAYLPIVAFWILDGYYLNQERLFRHLFNDVRAKEEANIDFSMNTKPFWEKENWLLTIFSKTLLTFYLPVVAITLVIMHCV